MGYASLVKTHLQKKNSLLNLIIKKDIEYVFNHLPASLSKTLTSRGGEPCAKEGVKESSRGDIQAAAGETERHDSLAGFSSPVRPSRSTPARSALSRESRSTRAAPVAGEAAVLLRAHPPLLCGLEVPPSPSDSAFLAVAPAGFLRSV